MPGRQYNQDDKTCCFGRLFEKINNGPEKIFLLEYNCYHINEFQPPFYYTISIYANNP
jgi:hypothetical protein